MTRPKRSGRYTPPKAQPPAHLVTAAESQRCPDCDSEIRLHREGETWAVAIMHDDNCVQLAFRQRHGATRSYAIVAELGHTISAELVAEVAAVVGEGTDLLRVTFGDHPAFDRTEREMLVDLEPF